LRHLVALTLYADNQDQLVTSLKTTWKPPAATSAAQRDRCCVRSAMTLLSVTFPVMDCVQVTSRPLPGLC